MLYLIATPIGNLGDIGNRAIELLKSADCILCEDTRHTLKLLNNYGISRPLKSYHQFNEAKRQEELIEELKAGKTLCLVSDAGTPGISDPGEQLVRRCHQEGIKVSPIPGPCAAVAALSASGMAMGTFTFWGFLPKKAGELKDSLITILLHTHTSICYVPPQQLHELLDLIAKMDPMRELTIARELTKQYEEVVQRSAERLRDEWAEREVRGELVLIIAACPAEKRENMEQISPKQLVEQLEKEFSLTKKEAILLAAKLQGVPKRTLYNALLEENH